MFNYGEYIPASWFYQYAFGFDGYFYSQQNYTRASDIKEIVLPNSFRSFHGAEISVGAIEVRFQYVRHFRYSNKSQYSTHFFMTSAWTDKF